MTNDWILNKERAPPSDTYYLVVIPDESRPIRVWWFNPTGPAQDIYDGTEYVYIPKGAGCWTNEMGYTVAKDYVKWWQALPALPKGG